jgi:hypothetical protein
MAKPGEVADIYTASMVRGLALVTFPAASTVLTSPHHYGLSSTEYSIRHSFSLAKMWTEVKALTKGSLPCCSRKVSETKSEDPRRSLNICAEL